MARAGSYWVRPRDSLRELMAPPGLAAESAATLSTECRAVLDQAITGTALRVPGATSLHLKLLSSPLGTLIAAAAEHLVLLEFAEPERLRKQLSSLDRHYSLRSDFSAHPLLETLADELREYFTGSRRSFSIPLSTPGTAFQRAVWAALCRVPYGETRSYADLAKTLGHANACRAVGAANGQNRIAIVIPCHRIITANGKLGGYGGGLWRKQWLLDLECGRQPLPLTTAPPSRQP